MHLKEVAQGYVRIYQIQLKSRITFYLLQFFVQQPELAWRVFVINGATLTGYHYLSLVCHTFNAVLMNNELQNWLQVLQCASMQ